LDERIVIIGFRDASRAAANPYRPVDLNPSVRFCGWDLSDSVVTPEAYYLRRRESLRVFALGLAASAVLSPRLRAGPGLNDSLAVALRIYHQAIAGKGHWHIARWLFRSLLALQTARIAKMLFTRLRCTSRPTSGLPAVRWVDDHGECLYRYALVRVRKPEVAEDLVQETFLAAVRGYEKFGGRSSERSWLVGILKNKIVDHFRKLGRETSFTDMEFLSDEFSEKFVSVGFWNHDLGPHEWKPEPDEVMHRAEFWQVMRDCLSKLPEKIRAVFTMREMDGVPSKEICAVLSITDSNLWVMLHRARMALRECLEMNWFDTPAGGTV
jgi:RNA polymerase sigma-70 factor (ECF subfamily)